MHENDYENFRRKGVTVHGVYSDRLRRKYGFHERNCKKM